MNRRNFLGTSRGAVLTMGLPTVWKHRPGPSHPVLVPDKAITLRDPRVKALALTALDAAHSSGAGYADVRLTYTKQGAFQNGETTGTAIILGLSVRALVNGYWGWAATPYLSAVDAPRVGRDAVRLARANAAGGHPRVVEWGTTPVVSDGTWFPPIRIDPFAVAPTDLSDWIQGLHLDIMDLAASRGSGWSGDSEIGFMKQERVFASTDGSYLAQTVYVTNFLLKFSYRNHHTVVSLPPAQGGLEYVLDAPLRDRVRAEMDRIDHLPPPLPVMSTLDVGRYDIIFTAETMAQLLAETLAPATELDRALGYEANADGTSYLGPDPITQLGTTITSPLITVTADRSAPKGLATIQWDDDGIVPEDFSLIKDGVLIDYQTTREQAAWLAPYYHKLGKPIRSHGCAASEDALSYPMQYTPNLTLHPGTGAARLEDLIANLDHGLLVDGMGINMDFQKLNGLGGIGGRVGTISEIRHGKLVSQTQGSGFDRCLLFRSPELWKNVLGIGGAPSLETGFIGSSRRGEPGSQVNYSVAAVPALVKQLAVIDPTRKA